MIIPPTLPTQKATTLSLCVLLVLVVKSVAIALRRQFSD